MANNGKGLATFGLIIGLIGLGLGGYVFYDTTVKPMLGLEEPTQEINTYYYDASNYSPITTGLENVTGPGLTITVSQNSSLYVCFNCYVYHGTGSYTTEVRLFINDVAVTNYMRVYTTTSSRIPMMLQYFDEMIEPGTYLLTIEGSMGALTGFYTTISLYAETISPV